MTIKSGQLIRVMRGADRGKQGKVLRVFPSLGRIQVEKVRLQKRHRKAQAGRPGGIEERAGLIAISSVMRLCQQCDKPTRTRANSDGQAICHRCLKPLT